MRVRESNLRQFEFRSQESIWQTRESKRVELANLKADVKLFLILLQLQFLLKKLLKRTHVCKFSHIMSLIWATFDIFLITVQSILCF